jgi:hypothetical protein
MSLAHVADCRSQRALITWLHDFHNWGCKGWHD